MNRPSIHSVKLIEIEDNTSHVEIKYSSENSLEGIELMGVDAGLDWIPGDSIMMEYEGKDKEIHIYRAILVVESSCEFRGRGFIGEEDHWEDGTNHTIERKEDGIIELLTDDYVFDTIDYKPQKPVIYEVDLETANSHIMKLNAEKPALFQLLVDISVWIKDLIEDPINSNKHLYLADLIRYLKHGRSEYSSKLVDNVVRPVYLAMTQLIIDISTFTNDDGTFSDEFDKELYLDIFGQLKDKVRALEQSDYNSSQDRHEHFKESLKYI